MTQELWTAVDTYIKEKMVPEDRVLTEALQNAHARGFRSLPFHRRKESCCTS